MRVTVWSLRFHKVRCKHLNEPLENVWNTEALSKKQPGRRLDKSVCHIENQQICFCFPVEWKRRQQDTSIIQKPWMQGGGWEWRTCDWSSGCIVLLRWMFNKHYHSARRFDLSFLSLVWANGCAVRHAGLCSWDNPACIVCLCVVLPLRWNSNAIGLPSIKLREQFQCLWCREQSWQICLRLYRCVSAVT